MPRRILVPLDKSFESQQALDHAFEEHSDAHITLLHVITAGGVPFGPQEGVPGYSEQWFETEERKAATLLEPAVEYCEEHAAVATETETVIGSPAQEIVNYVESNDIDHVVMGSHGRSGLNRILIGSVAEVVVRRSPVPVTVVR